jgi:hypothetical protein
MLPKASWLGVAGSRLAVSKRSAESTRRLQVLLLLRNVRGAQRTAAQDFRKRSNCDNDDENAPLVKGSYNCAPLRRLCLRAPNFGVNQLPYFIANIGCKATSYRRRRTVTDAEFERWHLFSMAIRFVQ